MSYISSVLTSGHGRALLVHVDGTIYLMDTKSRTMHWKLSTGSPILYSEQALSSSGLSEYFMDFDEDWNFYEYSKHTGKRVCLMYLQKHLFPLS